jgi:hypothetical protein
MLVAACERPDVIVMCHNTNCVGPPDPSRDDNMESLRASLALTYQGRPMLDGMELDIFWHGAANEGQGRCILAHDIGFADGAAAAQEAAREIGAYLERSAVASYNGQRFYVRFELKGQVGSYGEEHSPEQLRQHADCALELLALLDESATRGGHALRVIFDSSEPAVLDALLTSPAWPGRSTATGVEIRLSADFVDSTPSGLALQYLDDFPRVDDVVFHSDWIREGHYQAFRSLGLDLTVWMFSATSTTFDAIERLEPEAVLTSEAPLMRRWLSY